MIHRRWLLLAFFLLLLPDICVAQIGGMNAVTVTTAPNGGQVYSLTLQILLFMTVLTLLPSALVMLTSFTRIIIVLAILRQGLGTSQTPSNQILLGLAFFLTLFVMAPVFQEIYDTAVLPYLDEKLGTEEAIVNAVKPLRAFMLEQTRKTVLPFLLNFVELTDLNRRMRFHSLC